MPDKKSTFKTIRRFLQFLKPYWKKGVIAFFFMLLGVGLQLPMPFLTKYLIDEVIVLKSLTFISTLNSQLLTLYFRNHSLLNGVLLDKGLQEIDSRDRGRNDQFLLFF